MANYVGGPCNGRPVLGDIGDPRVCGGVVYELRDDGNYHPELSPEGGGGTAALGTHSPRAWANLQRSVNRKLPTSLRRSQVIRRATLRTLTRRRRVR